MALRTLGEQQQKTLSVDEAIAWLTGEASPPDLR